MKKIINGIILLCLMFMGTINVYAATDGHIKVTPETLKIVEGSNGTFDIIVTDAMVIASITSKNTDVIKINAAAYDKVNNSSLNDNGKWVSSGAGANISVTHSIPIIAVGKAGDTATIEIKTDDATIYGNGNSEKIATQENPLTYTVKVTIVEADEPVVTGYTVTYNANGGKDAPVAQTKKEGVALTLHTAKPTREGYTFTGWNTQKDGKGKSYEAGGKYTEDENVTLYAMWKATDIKENPNTGDTMIYVVLLLTLGALIYSYWYMKKSQEN